MKVTGQVTQNQPVPGSSHPRNTKKWNVLGRPHNFFRTLIQIPILKHGIAALRHSYITAYDEMYELRVIYLEKQYSVNALCSQYLLLAVT